MTTTAPSAEVAADFASFDRRAREGESLNVVFLGGSLTWGARATDPQYTSYRALVGRRLQEFYPKARFTCWDAAIGGIGSQLGVFRLERDVLRRRPDLVFLDFTINDHPFSVDPERVASYESLVRRILLEGRCPLVQVILAVKGDLGATPQPRPLDAVHKEISRAYQTALGDAVASMRQAVAAGTADPDQMWPYVPDVTHPGDKGYALYAEEAWSAFRAAVEGGLRCRVPVKMLSPDTYMSWSRQRLSQVGSAPRGWKTGLPHSHGVAFDFYMSRWLDDVLVAAPGAEPLRIGFRGRMALLFGEATPLSGKFEARIDGIPAVRESGPDGLYSAHCTGGVMHCVRLLAEDLDPTREHVLEIVPRLDPGQELRIESLCSAGAHAGM